MSAHRLAVALLGLLLLALASPAGAQEPAGSSLAAWLDAFSTRLEAVADGPRDGLTLTLTAGRGVDPRRVDKVLLPHLQRRLTDAAVVGPLLRDATHQLSISVSLEGDRVWAVGMLSGGALPAPVALAQDWPVDRELEALLGTRPARPGQGRWSMERLGTLPPGVLDLLLRDLDGDGGDDLVLLCVDGLRTYLWSDLEGRPVQDAGPVTLPARPWNRAPRGWLAWDGDAVALATSAGHRVRAALPLDALTPSPSAESPPLPLRQPDDPSRASLAWGRPASGATVVVDEAPSASGVRALQRWPGRDDAWLWVDGDGLLRGVGPAGDPTFPVRRVGDQLVLAELDGRAGPELVTTEASPPGNPDRIRIHSLTPELDRLTVLFEGALDGSVVAMDAGDVDFDGLGDLLFVEQTEGRPVLWIVRRRT